jgi:hypothetical protein
VDLHHECVHREYDRRVQEGHAPDRVESGWRDLVLAVRDEIAVAVEETLEQTRTMASYDAVSLDARRRLIAGSYAAVLDGMLDRRRPDASDDAGFFATAGETRARGGVAIRDMLALWRIGLENLHGLARRVVVEGPERDALLLEFLEAALAWDDFAMVNAAEGHRRAELALAREQHHAQTNCVRRVLGGTAAPSEIRHAVAPLGLDPDVNYRAVRVRPQPTVEMDAIERYLHADGLVRRGNGLLALIDGDACGFIAELPKDPAPTAIGVSEPAPLSTMAPAFREASRALETALALGAKGIFGFGDLGVQPAITTDAEVGEALVRRYIDAVLDYPSGLAILTTVERYLANDRAVEVTAHDLAVHPNTVRQRLERFEEATGRSLRETEAIVEVWWALQRRRQLDP